MSALSRPQLTRRQGLLSSVAACALFAVPRAQAAADLDKFMEISRQLTGRENLDQALGDIYLHAIIDIPSRAAALKRIFDRDDDGPLEMESVKKQILRQWYTGTYPSSDGSRVATFEQALMWDAMGMQPVGMCRGPVGFWSEPPGA